MNDLTRNENTNLSENVIAGVVGAFLFSLAGGALWFVLYLLGFIAGISGLIGAVCAIKGYSVFAKKESVKGIIISVVIALLVVVAAWYLCIGYDIYTVYQEWYELGEVDFTLDYFESVRAIPLFFEDPEISGAYIKDLLFGIVFCVVGGGSYVVNKIKAVKAGGSVNKDNTLTQSPDNDIEGNGGSQN